MGIVANRCDPAHCYAEISDIFLVICILVHLFEADEFHTKTLDGGFPNWKYLQRVSVWQDQWRATKATLRNHFEIARFDAVVHNFAFMKSRDSKRHAMKDLKNRATFRI